jgi:hypothetical protein
MGPRNFVLDQNYLEYMNAMAAKRALEKKLPMSTRRLQKN